MMAQPWRNRITRHADVDPSTLAANPANWRVHPKQQADALAGVLSEVGYVQSVIVNERSGRIVDGHLRVALAVDRVEPTVPVVYVDLADDEERLILATLDPIGALAETDASALAALLDQLSPTSDGLADLLASLRPETPTVPRDDPGAQIDRAEDLRQKWGTERGQLWEVGRHRLLCGDSTSADDVARLLDGARVRLLVTSPPYNQHLDQFRPSGMHREGAWVAKVERLAYADSRPEAEYQEWQRRALSVWFDALDDGASAFYNHKHRYRDKQVVSPLEWLPGPFRLRQEIIWSRPGSVTQNARMFLPSDERIYWLYRGDDFTFSGATEHKSWSTVWSIPLEPNVDFPCGFPVELPSRCIAACTEPGDAVLDPYAGSGTTLVAATQAGRIGYGLERDPAFLAICLERLAGMGLTPRRAD